MKFRKYRYTGPFSGATLNVDGKSIEIILNPQTIVELPEGHAYTNTLLARGHLALVEPEPAVIEPENKKGVKASD